MSKGEQIKWLRRLLKLREDPKGDTEIDVALKCAIKALEQQPCEDVVSRQAVLEVIRKCHCEEWVKADIGAPIEVLPPVTPQQKMGKWIIKRVDGYDHAICSVCDDDSYLSPEWDALELYKYCPNCGAKMSEIPIGAEEVRNEE